MSGPSNPAEKWNTFVSKSPAYRRITTGDDERFWERYSDVYISNRTAGTHYNRVVEWLRNKIHGRSLIEIGPGPCIFTRFLAAHCTRVTAVEPSAANADRIRLEMAESRHLKIERRKWEEVDIMPHELVFSAGTLHAFPNIEKAIAKMLRHASCKILLVTMNEEQNFQNKMTAAIGLPPPAAPGLSATLFLDVLRFLKLTFKHESFSEEHVYRYPDIGVLLDLWKDNSGFGPEHRSELEVLFKESGLYEKNGTAINVPKQITTYMVEICTS